jgi:asparagine synthetase B (glutamine-hydrolysing)
MHRTKNVIISIVGGLDSSVIVSVNIEDVNDNHPQFYPQNYSTNMNVNVQPGQDVLYSDYLNSFL